MEEKKLPLTLTGLEVVYLTDAVGNGDVAQGLPGETQAPYVPVGRELVLLLAGPYNEVCFLDGVRPGPCQIMVTLEQVWLMRSKVRTSDLDLLGQNIGVVLSRKLYELLLRFHSGVDDAFDVAQTEDQDFTYDMQFDLYEKGLL